MQSPQAFLKLITRLVSAFPPQTSAEPEEILRRYLEATEDCPFGDVETAVDEFIRGVVPGQNTNFAPTPPSLAARARMHTEQRNRAYNFARSAQKQIEERVKDEEFQSSKDPESMKRVAELAKLQAMKLVPDRKEDPEYRKFMKEQTAKNDALFADNFVEQENGVKVSKYLLSILNKDA